MCAYAIGSRLLRFGFNLFPEYIYVVPPSRHYSLSWFHADIIRYFSLSSDIVYLLNEMFSFLGYYWMCVEVLVTLVIRNWFVSVSFLLENLCTISDLSGHSLKMTGPLNHKGPSYGSIWLVLFARAKRPIESIWQIIKCTHSVRTNGHYTKLLFTTLYREWFTSQQDWIKTHTAIKGALTLWRGNLVRVQEPSLALTCIGKNAHIIFFIYIEASKSFIFFSLLPY